MFLLADDAKSYPIKDEVGNSADAVDDEDECDDDDETVFRDAMWSRMRCFARVVNVLMLITSVLGTGNEDEIVS